MRRLRTALFASVLTALALPGFSQVVDRDVASLDRGNVHHVCVTLTDACRADARFEEAASGLIDNLSLVSQPQENRPERHEALLDLPPKSGLDVVRSIIGSDDRDLSGSVTATPATLPESRSYRLLELSATGNIWHHGEPIMVEK